MIDVVRDLELSEQVERAREDAQRVAQEHVAGAERMCAIARRCYDEGDAAHAHGQDELAERLWLAAECLAGVHDDELDTLEAGT